MIAGHRITLLSFEKAADLIRGATPLEPSTASFYRHRVREAQS